MNVIRRRRKRFDIINYVPFIWVFIAVVLIIIFICTITAGNVKSIKIKKLQAMPFTAESTYVAFNGGAVYIQDDKLYYVDDRGEVMWGFEGAQEGMRLFSGEDKVGVAIGKKLQVITSDGALKFTKEFNKNISSVAVGKNLIAVSLSSSDDTIILNSTGEEIDRIVSNVNNTNIRFGTYSTSSVWVITVENSGYSPKYQLSTYKYDSGKTQTVTFSDDTQMMYDAVFNDNLCYIFGTEKIMMRDCDYTGSVNKDYSVNGYDVIACGIIDKSVSMLLMNNGRLKAIGEKGMISIDSEEKILFGAVSSKCYFGFSNYFMYTFRAKDGKAKKYRFPVRIDNVTQGEGYVLIESGNEVYRYTLKV
jgi:hypothetical protein